MTKSKGITLPINATAWLIGSVFATAVVLAVVVPMLQNMQGDVMCMGPWKATASMIADLTGKNVC